MLDSVVDRNEVIQSQFLIVYAPVEKFRDVSVPDPFRSPKAHRPCLRQEGYDCEDTRKRKERRTVKRFLIILDHITYVWCNDSRKTKSREN